MKRVVKLWACEILLLIVAAGLGILFGNSGVAYLMPIPAVALGISVMLLAPLYWECKKRITGQQEEKFWACETILLMLAVGLGILFASMERFDLMPIPGVVFGISGGLLVIFLSRKRKKRAAGGQQQVVEVNDLESQMPEIPVRYSYEQQRDATGDFRVPVRYSYEQQREATGDFRVPQQREATGDFRVPVRYSYEQLREATGDFRERLGGGGFGSVFKGTLENGKRIAVKCLEGRGQGKKEFEAEVKTIGSIHHVSLVKLIGYCAQATDRALVYEFLRNGSLDKWIFSNISGRSPLDWETRKKIILDVAKGLAHLHEECRQKIVHLDIKPQNILLDANLRAKISDFGLSRLIDRDQSQVETAARGTFGYMAPEIVLKGAISEKADVYSFGVVMLETVCGRRNLDRTQSQDLLTILREKQKADLLVDMIDHSIKDLQPNEPDAVKMIKVASLCLQKDYPSRPRMSMVVRALESLLDVESDLGYGIQGEIAQPLTSIEPSILSGPR